MIRVGEEIEDNAQDNTELPINSSGSSSDGSDDKVQDITKARPVTNKTTKNEATETAQPGSMRV